MECVVVHVDEQDDGPLRARAADGRVLELRDAWIARHTGMHKGHNIVVTYEEFFDGVVKIGNRDDYIAALRVAHVQDEQFADAKARIVKLPGAPHSTEYVFIDW